MKKTCLAFYATLFFIASNAQILRQQTSPQTIASEIPGFSEISSINTVSISYTPETPISYPDPVDGDTNTDFINQMNYIFSPLEKNRVPNGLLLDYAMEFTDLKNYNGVLTDTNEVSAGILRDIYSTVFMSAIHTNAAHRKLSICYP